MIFEVQPVQDDCPPGVGLAVGGSGFTGIKVRSWSASHGGRAPMTTKME